MCVYMCIWGSCLIVSRLSLDLHNFFTSLPHPPPRPFVSMSQSVTHPLTLSFSLTFSSFLSFCPILVHTTSSFPVSSILPSSFLPSSFLPCAPPLRQACKSRSMGALWPSVSKADLLPRQLRNVDLGFTNGKRPWSHLPKRGRKRVNDKLRTIMINK